MAAVPRMSVEAYQQEFISRHAAVQPTVQTATTDSNQLFGGDRQFLDNAVRN